MVDLSIVIGNAQGLKADTDCPLLQISMGIGVGGGASMWHIVFLSPMAGPGWWA